MAKLVAIHQPNLFPWLGFFDKLYRADTFVILDHVSNNATDGFWGKRVKILKRKGPDWITIPLVKPEGSPFIPINTMQPKFDEKDYMKARNAIYEAYVKAAFTEEIFPIVDSFFDVHGQPLSVMNTDFIKQMMEHLKIDTELVLSSKLNCKATATELMIEITKLVGGSSYLNGDGAAGYLDPAEFSGSGVEIEQQNFKHPTYSQLGNEDFIAGLSILDPLMNLGMEATAHLIKNPTST